MSWNVKWRAQMREARERLLALHPTEPLATVRRNRARAGSIFRCGPICDMRVSDARPVQRGPARRQEDLLVTCDRKHMPARQFLPSPPHVLAMPKSKRNRVVSVRLVVNDAVAAT